MSVTGTINEIKIDELKTRLSRNEPLTLINVLSEEWVQKSHGARLPGSHWIPVSELDQKAPLLFAKDETLVVYCGSLECSASQAGAKKLADLGFQNVLAYEGGLKEWREAGYPLESNQSAPVTFAKECSGGSCH